MEIGARLKEAREQKSLTLEDIQKITKIQTRYLQAIEKGNFEVMPGNFYVRAFVKEYATAVDLDPDQLMEEHKAELPASTDESTIEYSRVQRSRKNTSATKSPAIFSFLPTIIVVLLIVGIVFSIWYFYQQSQENNPDQQIQTEDNGGDQVRLPDDEQNQNQQQEEENEETEQPADSEVEEEENEPLQPTLNMVETGNAETIYDLENPGDQLTLTLSSDSENWLEVENGKGKSFYNEMFYADQSPWEQDMTGEEQIYLRFGNPTHLSITVNGITLELPDNINPSQVQRVWINVKNNTQ
ncbi:helix-turn-helix domain-containing protein [Aquibacillus albus]|uniref:Cytoskeletal protein RodZ n=1 Tax=Aquibacillus albus TaxID=1168171 RepID=A0ABS2N1T0_9BACI|nr:helix-turn-helix domain-containing protein [Aquibacillus albus]MBM7572094.1 cytoskeletal protein RodZ [Aquibacillus albus]